MKANQNEFFQQRNKIVSTLLVFCYVLGLISNLSSGVELMGILIFSIVGSIVILPVVICTIKKWFTDRLHYYVSISLMVLVFSMVASSPKFSNYMMIYFGLAVVMIYNQVKSIAISAGIGLILSNYFFFAFNQEMFHGADTKTLISLNIINIAIASMFLAQAYLGGKMVRKMTEDQAEVLQGKRTVDSLLVQVQESIAVLQEFSHNFSRTIHKTNTISSELNLAFSEISKGIESQAGSILQMNDSMSDSASIIAKAAEHSNTLHTISEETSHSSKDGLKLINILDKEIHDVSETVYHTATLMKDLNEETGNIGNILAKISEVTEQTNMLALNAAIEAARAGEAGKGFAVVAGEVKKLAETSKQSTTEIAAILSGIKQKTEEVTKEILDGQAAVSKGLEATVRTMEHFHTLQSNSQIALTKADELDERLNKLVVHSRSVVDEISSLSSVSEESSAAVEEVLASVEEQHHQIQSMVESYQELETLTDQLNLLVTSKG